MSEKLLEVKNLRVSYHTYAGEVQSVRGVSFTVNKGETVAVVGESGCGKSVTAKSIMRLIKTPPAEIKEGSEIIFDGEDVLRFNEKRLCAYRGGEVAMVFQDALGMVGIPQPESRVDQYPHEFSGGMRQRVMIAIAFACDPKLLIADEPTTALDVTIQAQIIDLIKALQKEKNASVILITHDLGVVANIADRIVVMYAGQIVERGTSIEVFHHPRHPYTNALLEAVPRLDLQNKQQLASIEGTPPDLIAPPKGCPFCTRCKYCMEICCEQQPPVLNFGDGHEASCWLYQLETPAADAPFTQEAHYEG